MEKLTKTEIKWTVDALQLTIGYYEQVMQRSTNQMERGMAKLQAENLGSVKKQAGACSFQRMQADCG